MPYPEIKELAHELREGRTVKNICDKKGLTPEGLKIAVERWNKLSPKDRLLFTHLVLLRASLAQEKQALREDATIKAREKCLGRIIK